VTIRQPAVTALGRLAGGQALHDAIVFGGGGWSAILERFAKAAETQ
jgi:hypothetical protein